MNIDIEPATNIVFPCVSVVLIPTLPFALTKNLLSEDLRIYCTNGNDGASPIPIHVA